jgi:hypothetical protein
MNFRFPYLLIPVILFSYFTGIYSYHYFQLPKNYQNKTINEPYQFSALIDGKSFLLTDNLDGIKSGSNSFKNIKKLPDSSLVVFQTYLYKASGGDVVVELNLGTLQYTGMKPSYNDFVNFFVAGKVNYSVMADKGVEIKYHDNEGGLWSTSYGTQQGSKFELSEFQKDSNSVKFKAIFNCTLYNSNHNFKTLDNGVFIGYFQNN